MSGFCVVDSLTSRSKVVLETGLQLSVGAAMVVLVLLVRLGRGGGLAWRSKRAPEDADLGTPLMAELPLTAGPVGSLLVGRGDDDRSIGTRLTTAAVNFALTAYGSVTLGAMKLMHCVHVPGTPVDQQRLFIAGDVVCNFAGWQLPLVALLGLLAGVPLALPFVAAWSRAASTHGDVPRASSCCACACRHGRVGVRRALVDAYSPRTPWWEAVLLAQRLVGGPVSTT